MRWWPPLLHLLAVALLVPLAVWRAGDALSPAEGPRAGAATAQGVEGAVDGALMPPPRAPVDLAALTARPLFQPGRQGTAGQAPAAEAPDQGAEKTAQVRMVGYLDDGSQPRAILSEGEAGREEIVRAGDAFGPYRVLSIDRDAVVLKSDDKEITVNMFGQ